MIDIELQRDSKHRLSKLKQDLNDARSRNKGKVVRQLTKEMQEEQKVLALIERVEVSDVFDNG